MLVHDARVRGKVHENEVGASLLWRCKQSLQAVSFMLCHVLKLKVRVVSVSQRVERAHGVPLTAAIHPQYVLFGLAQGLFDYGP